MKGKTAMHRTQLFLPTVLHKELKDEADAQSITLSELARSIFSRYLNKQSRYRAESGTQILLEMAEDS